MQILIPDSWLREYLKTDATPKKIQETLSLCAASVERLHKTKHDYVYDIEITTNRVDLMSVLGIAREAAAVLPQFGYTATLKNSTKSRSSIKFAKSVNYLNVSIDNNLCPRFTALLVRNVTVKPSPDWLTKRLELVGMRGLNNVVDISNYLMHLTGQPIHTFDYDKISKSTMILRESKKGEKLTTLDNKTHILSGGDIVICDGANKLIDLCGIMGGLNSAVDSNTKNVLLFVQTYEPNHIRRTSMTLAHRTSAAVLFEKGLPVENIPPTLEMAIELFKQLTHGTPSTTALDLIKHQLPAKTIKISPEFVNQRLGINLSIKEINHILSRLGFKVSPKLEVLPPPNRRLDITIPEDLVEEIARIYGYHNLPSTLMEGALPLNRHDKVFYWESRIKSAVSHWGFTEAYTYSLVAQDFYSPEAIKNSQMLKLKNPLSSEWEYLRIDLITSHRKIVAENLGRVNQIDLFEIANVYLPQKNNLPLEELHLVISSSNPDQERMKGIIEALENELNTKLSYTTMSQGSDNFAAVEINLDKAIKEASTTKTYTPISKYSPIIEDVNVTLEPNQKYIDLITHIKRTSSLIKEIDLIDKYQGKLTLRITYHSNSKQLTTEDIKPIREILSKLN